MSGRRRARRTRLEGKVQNLLDRLDLFVWRGMEDDDDGTDQTYRAANFAQQAELLVEKVGAQYGADEY